VTKRGRPRDNQRTAVYRWEQALPGWPGERMDLTGCAILVHQVWQDYVGYSQPPVVKDGRRRRKASGCRYWIKLPVWTRHDMIVLHEIAHALVHFRDPNPRQQAAHGPVFARLYLDLLGRYTELPIGATRSAGVHQKPRRVRYATRAALDDLKLRPLLRRERKVRAI
jgi:hypothetical protein